MNHQGIISGKREAISNWFRKFGTEILPFENKYRTKESLFGVFKWSEERILPKIDYVLIFRNVFAKCEACSIDEFENNIHAYYQVSLVHHKNRRIVVHQTKNKQEATVLAQMLSQQFNKPLKDATKKIVPGQNP